MALYPGKFDQVVIILSTGRTGTMGLARLFDTGFDNVKGLHEPRPSRNLRIASNKAVCGRLSREALHRKLARSRRKLLGSIDERIYVESNWFIYGFLDVLRDVYGPVKVLHVVRDPRTLIRSYINFGTFRGLKRLASNYLPHWILKTHQLDPRAQPRWSDMSEAERLAWIWTIINSRIDRAQAMFGEDYLRLRYEDLFSKDTAALKQVVSWMDLPWRDDLASLMHQEKTNASRADTIPRFEDWPVEEQQRVHHHCGELMKKYGYRLPVSEAAPRETAAQIG